MIREVRLVSQAQRGSGQAKTYVHTQFKEKVTWSCLPSSDNTQITINVEWSEIIPVDDSE